MQNKTKLILSFLLTSLSTLLILSESFQDNPLFFFGEIFGKGGQGIFAYLVLVIIIGQTFIIKTAYPFWQKVGVMFAFLIIELGIFVAVFLQALENAF